MSSTLDLDDSVPSVAITDSADFRQGSLLSSVTCTETNETTPPGAGTPSSYTSRSPSLGLLDNVPYPRSVSPAVTNQCDKTVIEDTGDEAAARGDQARDPGVRAITTQNIQGGPDKNQVPPPSSPGQQRQLRPARHPRINSIDKRTLRHRRNGKVVRPDNLPSVAVVILVRRPDRSARGTAREPPTKMGRRRSRDTGKDDDGEDNWLAHNSVEDLSPSLSESEREE
ncbi:hypothetical protein AbraIFM66950_001619, partial [Aspergillus brasiliensis]